MSENIFVCKKKGCNHTSSTQELSEEHYEKEHICCICAKDYTSSQRVRLVCPNKECRETFCKECLKKSICTKRESSDDIIKCFTCSQVFDIDYLGKIGYGSDFFNKVIFPKAMESFVKEQKSLLGSTQKYAKWQEDMENWKKVIRPSYQKEINRLKVLISNLQKELYSKFPYYNPGSEEKQFNFRCPNEGCHGFVDSYGNCGFCQKEFCLECREEKEDSHECDQDILREHRFSKERIETMSQLRYLHN